MTQFEQDLSVGLNVNNSPMSKGIYNLIITKRDISLFCIGMKPHRNWRLTDVKNYFGLKGSKESIKAQILELVEKHRPTKS